MKCIESRRTWKIASSPTPKECSGNLLCDCNCFDLSYGVMVQPYTILRSFVLRTYCCVPVNSQYTPAPLAINVQTLPLHRWLCNGTTTAWRNSKHYYSSSVYCVLNRYSCWTYVRIEYICMIGLNSAQRERYGTYFSFIFIISKGGVLWTKNVKKYNNMRKFWDFTKISTKSLGIHKIHIYLHGISWTSSKFTNCLKGTKKKKNPFQK